MSIERKIREVLNENDAPDVDETVTEDVDDVVEAGTSEVIEDVNALDMSEDVSALIEGEDLPESFKAKAATIFEAAVLRRVKEELATIEEAYDVKLEAQVEAIREGLGEKVNGYLGYIAEQWITQNEIALVRGMRTEVLEGFVGRLKEAFEESYIDVPEERFDVLESLETRATELTESLDEQLAANVELRNQLAGYQALQINSALSEGLVATDKAKFQALVEELEFDSIETYEKKAKTIRESYFNGRGSAPSKRNVASVVTDTPVTLQEEASASYVDPSMKGYTNALDALTK